MPSPAICRLASPSARIAAQYDVIQSFETLLWQDGFNEALLPSYQSAWRRLEALIAEGGEDRRHDFVLVIPVADSPRQLQTCLASLIEHCRVFGYGGMREGVFRKLSVMLADDSEAFESIARNQAIAREFAAQGLAIDYFGLIEQRALYESLGHVAGIEHILGMHRLEAFAHKGQAMMRNLAWLKLAQSRPSGNPVLYYTLDADQQFRVKVETPEGDRTVYAVNFLAQLDAIFSATDAAVLTGKVVGDPPVSPAVMAGNFLDDVTAFLLGVAANPPDESYRAGVRPQSGDAAYHDMAELFGFAHTGVHPYRPQRDGLSHAECFDAFSRHLARFFHGEHPTRTTYYRHHPALQSVAPARTVYTGNAVFRASALEWFIPFAPLRLRMSGPTLGRLLQAELGPRFVSANLPMLHTRTLDDTGQSEYRPGVVDHADTIDLADEFERQFYGDVMLFSVEQLTKLGFPKVQVGITPIVATLDAVHDELIRKYRGRRGAIDTRLQAIQHLLNDPAQWWHAPVHAAALERFRLFLANLAHNFGHEAPVHARIEGETQWPAWRSKLADAIERLHADRQAWQRALAFLQTRPA